MKRIVILASMLFVLAAPVARAGDVVVVELFTSQGCDKCPPADVLLEDLATEPNVLALSWHVDYWDFMGWKDSMAKPGHKERQEAYNQAMGTTGVLTPQFVINGRKQIMGPKKLALYQTVSDAAVANNLPVHIGFEGTGKTINVALNGKVPDGAASVRLIWHDSLKRLEIKGGANSGKKMDYVNVVTASPVIGTFGGGSATYSVDLDDPARNGADCLAILVQEGDAGPILGAGRFCP